MSINQVKKQLIPITKPNIENDEIRAVEEVLRSGWLVQGPQVAAFEKSVADYCGLPHGIATTSCTTALQMAMIAMGIGPGDAVLLPAFTFVASANAVVTIGATPLFVDILPDTFNMDPASLEEMIKLNSSSKEFFLKAVIPVHLFGLCAEMDDICRIAEDNDLMVIEDAACALGAKRGDLSPGQFGKAACFSFHPRKIITTGEGGMIVTRDQTLSIKARMLRNHGAEQSDLNRHEKGISLLPDYPMAGFNYRMTDIQAAIGVSQMIKLSDLMEKRKRLAMRYSQELSGLDWLEIPACPPGSTHTYQSYVCHFADDRISMEKLSEKRNVLFRYMKEHGVALVPGTHAVTELKYYRDRLNPSSGYFPHAQRAHLGAFTLPLHPAMVKNEQDLVISLLREFKG